MNENELIIRTEGEFEIDKYYLICGDDDYEPEMFKFVLSGYANEPIFKCVDIDLNYI